MKETDALQVLQALRQKYRGRDLEDLEDLLKAIRASGPRRFVREKEAVVRLGCGRTKFRNDYVRQDPNKPFVPETDIERLRAVPLGPRNFGFLDHEIDDLIDALAALRVAPKAKRLAAERDVPTVVKGKAARRASASAPARE